MALKENRVFLCTDFPLLGLENRSGYRPGQAAALVQQHRILACNSPAAEQGIRTGMAVATAQALSQDCLMLEQDTATEQHSLQQLALQAYRYTPYIRVLPGQLLLDIGASLRLFRGLPALLQQWQDNCRRAGYSVRCGIGQTPEQARLLCRQAVDPLDVLANDYRLDPDQVLRQLDAQPATRIDCPAKTLNKLDAMGLQTLGQLRALPTAALKRRLGADCAHYLERLFGQRPEHLAQLDIPREFDECRQFIEPVKRNRDILAAMADLLDDFCRYLQLTQMQCQQLCWQLHRQDGGHLSVTVTLSAASHRKQGFLELSKLQLEQRPALKESDAFSALSLCCRQLVARSQQAIQLFADDSPADCHALLDRLLSRLGQRAVSQLQVRDEHLPEKAWARHTLPAQPTASAPALPERPLWLLPTPRPLHQRGPQLYWRGPLELLGPPERISGYWWQYGVDRDYRVARNNRGEWCWLYQQRSNGRWFLHGIYA